MNIAKKVITGTIIAGAIAGGWFGGEYAITLHNINKFRDDLMVFNVEEEKATEIAEYFHGQIEGIDPTVGGARDEFIRALNEAREESGMLVIGGIENKEDLLKMFNSIISIGAQMKRVKQEKK